MIAITSPGAEAIIKYWESKPLLKDKRWLAYILATAYHETAHTFEPVREIGRGKLRAYGRKRKQSGEPYTIDHIYYGRGHVQLTWYENYDKFGKLLGIDLTSAGGAAQLEGRLGLPAGSVVVRPPTASN
jgi:hypothetical protein